MSGEQPGLEQIDPRLLYPLRFSVSLTEFPDWIEEGLCFLELYAGEHVPGKWYFQVRIGGHMLWVGWSPRPPEYCHAEQSE